MREIEAYDLINLMNYNLSRKKTKISKLGNIEKRITQIFFEQDHLTDEQIENFETNLFSNPQIFDNSIDYSSIKDVGTNFKQMANSYRETKQRTI